MDHTELREHYARLCGLYRDRKYEEALALLDGLLAHYPNNPTLVYSQALALASARRYPEAVERCDRLIREFRDVRGVELRALIAASEADEVDTVDVAPPAGSAGATAADDPVGVSGDPLGVTAEDRYVDPLADETPWEYIDPLADEPESAYGPVTEDKAAATAPFGSRLPDEDSLHGTPQPDVEADEEPVVQAEPAPDAEPGHAPGETVLADLPDGTGDEPELNFASDEMLPSAPETEQAQTPAPVRRPVNRRLAALAATLIALASLAAVVITVMSEPAGPPPPPSPRPAVEEPPPVLGAPEPPHAVFPEDRIFGLMHAIRNVGDGGMFMTPLRGKTYTMPGGMAKLRIWACHDIDLPMVGELIGESAGALELLHPDLDEAGFAALERFPLVEELDLGNATMLTDAGLARVAAMTKLRRLTVRGAYLLTDAALGPLASLQEITELDLAETSLTDASAGAVAAFRNIEILALPAGATAASLPALAGLPALASLRLGPAVSGEGLAVLASFPVLRELRLDAAGLGAELAVLQGMENLESLTLAGTPEAAAWDILAAMPGLRALRLSGCAPPPGFFSEGAFASLGRVDVEAAPLDDGGVALLRELAALPALTACGFTNSPVTNEAVSAFKDHPGLQYLGLGGTAIAFSPLTSDSPEAQMAQHTLLEVLRTPSAVDLANTAVEPFREVLQTYQWIRGVTHESGMPDANQTVALFPMVGLPGRLYSAAVSDASGQTDGYAGYSHERMEGLVGYPRGVVPVFSQQGLCLELESDNLESLGFAAGLPFRAVSKLTIRGRTLNPEAARHVGQFQGLETLSLHITELSPEALDAIVLAPPIGTGLEYLSLEDTPLRNEWLNDTIYRLTQLRSLNLAGTGVTDAELVLSPSLDGLSLARCPVGDEGVRLLAASLPNLSSLNLSETHVTDEGARSLRVLFNLQGLDLTGTAVSEAERAALALALPGCRIKPGPEATPAL